MFNLEKQYLDLIDSEGNCFIVYRAKLKISFFRLSYSSIIISKSNGKTIEKVSFKKILTLDEEDTININLQDLNVKGKWSRKREGIHTKLYRDKHGKELIWHCHHPLADVEIEFQKKKFSGLGYAETIILPISPWKLPIEILRWGRYLSEQNSIIWIEWNGSFPINNLYYNGECFNDSIFNENSLSFGKNCYSLNFEEPITIRKGELSSIAAKIPWIRFFFKTKFLNGVEIKYKSKSNFKRDGEIIDLGWSLFEIVKWEI